MGKTGGGFENEGGTLEVKPLADGPLLLSGNVTIISGNGRTAWQGYAGSVVPLWGVKEQTLL